MNMKRKELVFYELELGNNAVEDTKIICRVKTDDAIDPNWSTRW